MNGKDASNGSPWTPKKKRQNDSREFIHSMLVELRQIAHKDRHDFLRYLIEMAEIQCEQEIGDEDPSASETVE